MRGKIGLEVFGYAFDSGGSAVDSVAFTATLDPAVVGPRLREQGVVKVDLNVRKDNPVAFAFWQSVGFELAHYQMRQYL